MTNEIDVLKMATMEYDKAIKIKRMNEHYLSSLLVHYTIFVNMLNEITFYYPINLVFLK